MNVFTSDKTKSSYCTKNHVMRKQIFCQNILLTHSCNSVCDSQLNHSTTSSKVFFFCYFSVITYIVGTRWNGLGSRGKNYVTKKGADQLRGYSAVRGYSAADLHLCFRICKMLGFLMTRLVSLIRAHFNVSKKIACAPCTLRTPRIRLVFKLYKKTHKIISFQYNNKPNLSSTAGMPTSSEARLNSDGLNSKLCCFVTHLTVIPPSQFT